MAFSRRSAMVLAATAPTAGLGLPFGGETDASMVGVMVRMAWHTGGWKVWTPDEEAMSPGGHWRPGMTVPGKWVPLQEFLKEVEGEYHLEESNK